MSELTSGRRGRRLTAAASGVLVLVAAVLIGFALHGQQHVATPPSAAARPSAEGNLPAPTTSAAPTSSTTEAPAATSTTPAVAGPVLPRSAPVALDLPSIHLAAARLVKYGQDRTGAIAVPPAAAGTPAGWFTGSPAPGQLGPSVIVGHVDSAGAGPSVFFHLGELRPGDQALVTLADRTVAVFRVDSVETYSKAEFPTLSVYGNINHAGLRLITCGGPFNAARGHYEDNIVVYAHLVGSRPA